MEYVNDSYPLHISSYNVYAMHFLTALRPMEKIIEQTIEYTRDRKIFGKSILDNQVVHFRLAELQTDLECFRSLVYRTVGKYQDLQTKVVE